MIGGPRPLPVAAGASDDQPPVPAAIRSGRACRSDPAVGSSITAPDSSRALPVRARTARAAKHRQPSGGAGAGRTAAGLAHHHAGRRHDGQGPRGQARRARQGRAQVAARSPVDDDHQLDDRHRHRARSGASVRRRRADPQLRRGADRGRIGSRRRARTWSRARRSSRSWVTSITARPRCSTRFATTRVAEREAGGITQHIGAYLVPVGEKQRQAHRLPRHARSRSVHADARPRVARHRRRRAGRRGRRRRHAADQGSDRSRARGQRADHRRGQQDRQARREPGERSSGSSRISTSSPKTGAARRCSSRSRRRRRPGSICCSR